MLHNVFHNILNSLKKTDIQAYSLEQKEEDHFGNVSIGFSLSYSFFSNLALLLVYY